MQSTSLRWLIWKKSPQIYLFVLTARVSGSHDVLEQNCSKLFSKAPYYFTIGVLRVEQLRGVNEYIHVCTKSTCHWKSVSRDNQFEYLQDKD